MAKIRVLTDQVANQIAAGEVVERPASVAKELVENAIDAGARRITIESEAGGRGLLRVADDGEGMSRDDAVLAFERHATSKISSSQDLARIGTLGFRGEALASIASVARVELITQTEDEPSATRVVLEGGRMRDVSPAAHPRGTTLAIRDLFFNVPARRKFLRSEATETFHLTNLVTHYALAHPEIAFTLLNNGREILRAAPAGDERERVYQIFGREFLAGLLEVRGGRGDVTLVRGFVSAPRERRTSRDAQYLFVNRRYVRDRLISRALSEAYRGALPPGTYPVALLFLDTPLEEVDVNVHPAKTEVRFRRPTMISETVREAVRDALAGAGYARRVEHEHWNHDARQEGDESFAPPPIFVPPSETNGAEGRVRGAEQQPAMEFAVPPPDESAWQMFPAAETFANEGGAAIVEAPERPAVGERFSAPPRANHNDAPSPGDRVLPPLVSALGLVREADPAALSAGRIRPLGQLEESFIVATDDVGLLLIDQHVAHERVLYEQYRVREGARTDEAQHLLMPETFDLSPPQAAAFDLVAPELETYGFSLMRLSGRTVAITAVPANLPPAEARNL
ncbi:MAG TPA: DNA mismatch repair endonuclease MutL, partial [Pyrinomonadaceae bacterium]|nr:DNA mismatch repair endonuclease MutL [Pyrinomonadaceae bacterium]